MRISIANGQVIAVARYKFRFRLAIACCTLFTTLTAADVARGQNAAPSAAAASQTRKSRRPPTVRAQLNLETASKTTAEFRSAPELVFKKFYDLTLGVGTFENSNAAELGLPAKFELLCYNGQPVGPTIRARRGSTIHIHLKNDLPKQTAAAAHQVTATAEQPHDFCVTNLHTHGLHVSPAGNADNVFIEVKPQEDFTYELSIPADHPAGTFWYHPHKHGGVAYQLSNGVAGALIIEGTPNDGIADLEDIPEIAAAKEVILLFQLYSYRVDPPGKDGIARIDAKKIYDVMPDDRACPAIKVPNEDPQEFGQATAINGVINPILRMEPGELQRWRLIHGAWDINRRLYLSDSAKQSTTEIQFNEIAVDGLATGSLVPKSNDPNAPNASLVEIAPGQRSDVLIQAPQLKYGEKERIYYLMQSGEELGAGAAAPAENTILAKIIVAGVPRHMRPPDPSALLKCKPFADIRADELATTGASDIATGGLRFRAITPTQFQINNKTFSQFASPTPIHLGTAEEWKVRAQADNHPFHIHVNPFEVVMRTDDLGNSTPMNVWRDTLLVRQGETYTIRSRFQDFLGKTVLHCHFLDHEDQGMMMPIEFVPPYPTTKTAAAPQAGLKTGSTPAPALKLPDLNGAWHDLANFRGRNVVLIFFQGIACSHCAEQLYRFVHVSREKSNQNTEIIAVSGRRIDDPKFVATRFDTRVTDRFTLLVDERGDAFRAFDCYKEHPLHGVFLIDGAGQVRASYTGETPFDDVDAIVDAANAVAETRTGPK